MSSGTASRNHIVANPEGLSATAVLVAFGEWLDQRLSEAMRLDMDLAFRDRPFDVEVGRTPALVGWEHRYLQPAPRPRAARCGPFIGCRTSRAAPRRCTATPPKSLATTPTP
jgi:hypothetical protein